MKFSNPVKYSGLVQISPNNKLVAFSNNFNVSIYDIFNLQLVNTFSFSDSPSVIDWAFNSSFIMIGIHTKSLVEIKSVSNKDKTLAKIDEGFYGISHSFLSSLSTKVFILNENALSLKVFSLKDSIISVVNNIKYLQQSSKTFTYSNSKHLIGIIQQVEAEDFVSIYKFNDSDNDQEALDLLSCFEAKTDDLSSVEFTKDECYIICFESLIYSQFTVFDILGNLIKIINPFSKPKLGVSHYTLSKSYLAVGFYDDEIRLYNTTSWENIKTLKLNSEIELSDDLIAFKEMKESFQNIYSLEDKGVVNIKAYTNYNTTSELASRGFLNIEFSSFSSYLSAVFSSCPNLLFIWKTDLFSLFSIVIQLNPISTFNYIKRNKTFGINDSVQNTNKFEEDNDNLIALATENKNIYLVSPNEASVCSIPTERGKDISIDKLLWSSDGNSLICSDRNFFFYSRLLSSDENIEELPEEIEEDES